MYAQFCLKSVEDFLRMKSAKHVLNADISCGVYHYRQTSSFAQTIPCQNTLAAGKYHGSGESVGAYLHTGGKGGASTAPYPMGTECEVAGALY